MNQNENKLENQIYELSKTTYNTLKESGAITYKYGSSYFNGLLSIPYISLAIPTFISEYKKSYDERIDYLEKYGKSSSLDKYSSLDMILFASGLITSIELIAEKYEPVINYVFNHPYLLAIPIITNILSAGYEKQKKTKN
jgi:hypothetical protein